MRTAALFACLGLSLLACRSDDPKHTGDDDTKMDAPPSGQMTIQDVQGDAVGKGDPVSLSGVIVTAIDVYGMKVGDIWIEEPGGGPFSGVHVFGVPTDVVSTLQPGDIISVDGAVKDEFVFNPQPDETGSVTEIKPATSGSLVVTVTGHTDVPTPDVVDALAIGKMTDEVARTAEWEKWEGVLIKVSNVSTTSTLKTDAAKPDQDTIKITGGIQLESGLASLGTPMSGDCLGSVTGVLDWFYDYNLYPRSTAEIVTGGTGCPAKEADHASCSDGMDNDGNGFADCLDFSCQMADPACAQSATVAAIQMGTLTGTVMLSNVFVTGRDDTGNNKGVWVADSLAGAPFNGVYVYLGAAGGPVGAVIGATVNVTGSTQEFDVGTTHVGDTLTEIGSATVTVVAPPSATLPSPAPTATFAEIGDIGAPGEQWEGVLVKVTSAKVTSATTAGKTTLTDPNGKTLVLYDDSFNYHPATPLVVMGGCYNITGLASVQLTDDTRTINPRSADDIVPGTNCMP